MRTSIGLAFSMLALSGCQGGPPLSAKYQIETRFTGGQAISQTLLLLGDNQTNNVAGGAHFLSTGIADSLVSVAIRPIQLDFYGQSLLTWSLQQQDRGMPIVHMGDATNTSCTGELERFFETMKAAQGPWVMVPGNHDGTYSGNGDVPESKNPENLMLGRADWRSACEHAGAPLDRAEFLTRYLRVLALGRPDLRGALPGGELGEGEWAAAPAALGLLRRVHWNIRRDEPWRSFVVQEIDFSISPRAARGARGFLLDTSQYARRPTIVPTPLTVNTGLSGEIQEEQAQIVSRWSRRPSGGQGKYDVLFGHHPYEALTGASRAILDRLRAQVSPLTYVSAHTHLGRYYVHPDATAEGETWVELNVGSIVDTPIEYRTFQIHTDKRQPGRIGFHTDLVRPVEAWFGPDAPEESPVCDAAWEAKPPGEHLLPGNDYYLSYQHVPKLSADAMRRQLMDVMLVSYSRMIAALPPEPPAPECAEVAARVAGALASADLAAKRAAVAALLSNRCDPLLTPQVAKRRRDWALCQSAWASKYEHLGNRAPSVHDWYVTFPAPHQESQ